MKPAIGLVLLMLTAIAFYTYVKSDSPSVSLVEREGVVAESGQKNKQAQTFLESPKNTDTEKIEAPEAKNKKRDRIQQKKFTAEAGITVYGRVTDDKGNAIPDLTVITKPVVSIGEIKTDSDGKYRFIAPLSALQTGSLQLRYIKLGFILKSEQLNNLDTSQSREYQVNMVLDRFSGFSVSGYMLDNREGSGIAGQRVYLYSPKQNRETRIVNTNEDGFFSIPYVPPGDDYIAKVISSAGYEYDQSNALADITVTDSPVEITLYSTSVEKSLGSFNLQLVDSDLLPLSGVAVELAQGGKPLATVTSDANGQALFDKVPEGKLTLSAPRLNMRVNSLERDQHQNAILVADLGNNFVDITVLGNDGFPFRCQQASLLRSYKKSGYIVRFDIPLKYKQDGTLSHSRLGSHEYSLNLAGCEGYQAHTVKIYPGSESFKEIQLIPR